MYGIDPAVMIGIGAYVVVLLFLGWKIQGDIQTRVAKGGESALTKGEIFQLIVLPPVGLGAVALGIALVLAVIGGMIVIGAFLAALGSK